MTHSTGEQDLSEDDELLGISADLVSLDENHPFITRLFSLNAGQWLDVLSASFDLSKTQKRLRELKLQSDGNMYAAWLEYPQQQETLDESESCVIVFFTDVDHWITSAVFNKQYFTETHS